MTIGLVLVATAIGIAFKLSQGRGHAVLGHERVDLKKLKGMHGQEVAIRFGTKATSILFSTSYCSICPSVRRQLQSMESIDAGLQHVDVDITDRLDLAAHFGISQTPTVLITDASGVIRYRVSGTPKPGVLMKELSELGVSIK